MKQDECEKEYRDSPLAYLITIRSFGTWLHGATRSSVDRHGFNTYGTPLRTENPKLQRLMEKNMRQPAVVFDGSQCKVIESAIQEVCAHRNYELFAVYARTNHAHAVVSAECKPEPIADAFKSYSTRKLREGGLIEQALHPWARGRSRRYLWKPEHVARTIEYVLFGQGDEIPSFDH